MIKQFAYFYEWENLLTLFAACLKSVFCNRLFAQILHLDDVLVTGGNTSDIDKKFKFLPRTGHEGPRRPSRCTAILFL